MSLQDLFSADSPTRPAPGLAALDPPDSPESVWGDAGPSTRRNDAMNPLFLSPGASSVGDGTPARNRMRKRARDDFDSDGEAGSPSKSRATYNGLPSGYVNVNEGAGRTVRIQVPGEGNPYSAATQGIQPRAALEIMDDPFAVADPLAGLNGSTQRGTEEGVSVRRTRAKIDAERLLGPHGLPALCTTAKKFKVNLKSKGSERGKDKEQAKRDENYLLKDNLNRLLDVYQMWAHGMFPKGDFAGTVKRVETVCRTRRMESAISGLRDAFNESTHDVPADEEDDLAAAAAAAESEEAQFARIAQTSYGSQPLFDEHDEEEEDDPDLDDMIALEEMEREQAASSAAMDSGARTGGQLPLFGEEAPPVEEEDFDALYD